LSVAGGDLGESVLLKYRQLLGPMGAIVWLPQHRLFVSQVGIGMRSR
jgi:hypothetical protein